MRIIRIYPAWRRLLVLPILILLFTPSVLSAQSPLKDLAKGNIFYYYYRAGSLDFGYFFEKVIGDTLILGNTYAKVYSDPWKYNDILKVRTARTTNTGIDIVRYERSNDSALYEWVPKENKEYVRLRHLPNYKAGDRFYLKTPVFDCSFGCRVGLDLRVRGFDLDGNPISWEFISTIGTETFAIDYSTDISHYAISNRADNQRRADFNVAGGYFVKFGFFNGRGTTINFIQLLDTLLQTSRITVGVREQEAATSLTLAPNPVSDEANVTFSLASSKRVRLVVVDNLGRVLLSVADAQLPAGEHRFPVRTEALANGVYWVRLWADAGVQTVPLVVRK